VLRCLEFIFFTLPYFLGRVFARPPTPPPPCSVSPPPFLGRSPIFRTFSPRLSARLDRDFALSSFVSFTLPLRLFERFFQSSPLECPPLLFAKNASRARLSPDPTSRLSSRRSLRSSQLIFSEMLFPLKNFFGSSFIFFRRDFFSEIFDPPSLDTSPLFHIFFFRIPCPTCTSNCMGNGDPPVTFSLGSFLRDFAPRPSSWAMT